MFDCQASSGSKISWFKRVQGSSSLTSILKLGKRFNVFPNGSLKINPVQKIDEAFYRCRADNPIGYNNASAFLRVLGMYGFIERLVYQQILAIVRFILQSKFFSPLVLHLLCIWF